MSLLLEAQTRDCLMRLIARCGEVRLGGFDLGVTHNLHQDCRYDGSVDYRLLIKESWRESRNPPSMFLAG